jgi:hypothetical protein
LQSIRIKREGFRQIIESKVPCRNPVLAGQNLLLNRAGSRVELPELLGLLKRLPALLLRKALPRGSRPQSRNEHASTVARF